MAKVINLRRARKAKERDERLKRAEANRRKHGRTRSEKEAERAEAERLDRAHRGARREGAEAEAAREAVCAKCLCSVSRPELALEGYREKTVYAADDLAFPAIALPDHLARCEVCSADTVPLLVRSGVASTIAAYLRRRSDEN